MTSDTSATTYSIVREMSQTTHPFLCAHGCAQHALVSVLYTLNTYLCNVSDCCERSRFVTVTRCGQLDAKMVCR
jgi:hypothetical protein